MTILKFLEINDISDTDDYGSILLGLVLDLCDSIRRDFDESLIHDKARNIIQVCCEPMFDDLIELYEWSPEETDYADQVIVQCMEVAIFDLLKIVQRRPSKKHQRKELMGLLVESPIDAMMMAYIIDVPNNVCAKLESSFLEDHGGMYFN